jgi:hypothetical protein
MKKLLLSLTLVALATIAYANAPEAFSLQTTVVNIAGNTTNSTAATAKYLNMGETPVRIYLTATGNAGTTNGAAAGAFTVKLSTASGQGTGVTNAFDTAHLSNIKLVISNSHLTSSTVTVSDWFVLSGAKYLRVGQIENTSPGTISNILIKVGYPTKE